MKKINLFFFIILNVLIFNINSASSGNLDTSFGGVGYVVTDLGGTDIARSLTVQAQSDGKIIAAGQGGSPSSFALVRYNTDGSLDTSFGTGGIVITNVGGGGINVVELQSDGKIVASGVVSGDFALARYNTDGSLDTSFGTSGIVTTNIGGNDEAFGLALQSDGKIITSGTNGSDFVLARYNTDGSLDTSFGTGGIVTTNTGGTDIAYSVAIVSDGIIASGTNGSDFVLAKYDVDGNLDTSFGTGGIVTTNFGGTEEALAMVLQPDEKIILVGYTSNSSSVRDFALARYNTDGSLDTSFGTGGIVTTSLSSGSDIARGVALQSNGQIIAGGQAAEGFGLAKYNTDGTLDTTFGTGGIVITDINISAAIYGVDLQSNGKIVVSGYSGTSFATADFTVARYCNDLSAPTLSTVTSNCAGIVTVTGSGAESGATITIYADGNPIGTGNADGSGSFNFSSSSPLTEGTYSIAVTQTSGSCDSAQSNAMSETVNRTPATPILSSVSSNCAGIVTVTGSGAESGATITIYADGNPIGTGIADGSGNFNFSSSTALVEGTYSITVTQTESGCESSESNAISETINRTPATPILSSVSSNCAGIVTVTGSGAESGATITIYADGNPIGTGIADGSGNFNFSSSTALAEGTYSITVTQAESGCESVQSNAISETISRTPATPVLSSVSSNCAGIVTVTGSGAESGATITIYADGVNIGTSGPVSGGNFSVSSSVPLAEGTYSITVTQTEGGCTSAQSNAISEILDFTPTVSNVNGATSRNNQATVIITATNPCSDNLTFNIITGPSNGTITSIEQTSTTTFQVTYNPNTNFVGTDSFTYEVCNSVKCSAPGTASIIVSGTVSSATIYNGQSGSFESQSAVLLLEGQASEGTNLTFSIINPPQHGALSPITQIDANTSQVTYTPDPGYIGPDSFTYIAFDGTATTNIGTYNLNIIPDFRGSSDPALQFAADLINKYRTVVSAVRP